MEGRTLLAWLRVPDVTQFHFLFHERRGNPEIVVQHNVEDIGRNAMNSSERREIRYQRRKARRAAKRAERIENADDFDAVFTYSNLYDSYKKCLRNVKWKASVQTYSANAPLNVFKSFHDLQEGKIDIHKGYEFDLYERGKKRHIRSVHIRERVVQKCLCDYALVPVLGRSLIYDNGASTKGKGVKFARERLQAHLEKYIRQNGSDGYILIFDFKKFFDSIQHRVVLDVMKKGFTDRKIIGLTMKFVGVSGDIGLGLGSQISQSLCLAVPNMLDHAIKERCRMKFFGRYMDDGYIIHKSKEKLKECMEVMKEICARLGLTLNLKKTHIRKLSGGFSFLKWKYHVLPSGKIIKRPSRQSITRMRRRMKRFKKRVEAGLMSLKAVCQSFQSWRSHISKTRCYRSLKRMDELFMQLFGMNYKEGCRCITKLCRAA